MTPLNSIITSGKTFHLIAVLTALSLLSFGLNLYYRSIGFTAAGPIGVSTLIACVSLILLIKDNDANPQRTGLSKFKNDFVFIPQILILLLSV